jgi:hypothetical protein
VTGTLRICVVGAGRMGRALAARVGTEHEVVVVSRRPGRLRSAGGRELTVGSDPAAVAGCGLVLLAVPAPEVAAAAGWVAPHADPGVVAVNLATELPTSDVDVPGLRVVGCKIIGQSGQIERGVPAALIADGATGSERTLLATALGPVGVVLDGPEDLVARVNDLVARRMIAAQLDLLTALGAVGLPAGARDAVLGNLAVGVWSAVAAGNTGPFLTRILEQARTGVRAAATDEVEDPAQLPVGVAATRPQLDLGDRGDVGPVEG